MASIWRWPHWSSSTTGFPVLLQNLAWRASFSERELLNFSTFSLCPIMASSRPRMQRTLDFSSMKDRARSSLWSDLDL